MCLLCGRGRVLNCVTTCELCREEEEVVVLRRGFAGREDFVEVEAEDMDVRGLVSAYPES